MGVRYLVLGKRFLTNYEYTLQPRNYGNTQCHWGTIELRNYPMSLGYSTYFKTIFRCIPTGHGIVHRGYTFYFFRGIELPQARITKSENIWHTLIVTVVVI